MSDRKPRRRFIDAVMGTQKISWPYALAFQALLMVMLTSVQWVASTTPTRIAWLLLVGIGEIWLLYQVVRRARSARQRA